MRKILALTLLTFGLALCPAAGEAALVGGLRIDWLDSYEQVSDSTPFAFTGQSGEKVLVTVWGDGSLGEAKTSPKDQSGIIDAVVSRLPQLAAAQGKVVVSLRQDRLENGSVVLSTATSVASENRPEFYLQYLLVIPKQKTALFTVEGAGDALSQHPLFLERVGSIVLADGR